MEYSRIPLLEFLWEIFFKISLPSHEYGLRAGWYESVAEFKRHDTTFIAIYSSLCDNPDPYHHPSTYRPHYNPFYIEILRLLR
jgi:hypothetical protein